ncbi:hypothetical protein I2W78_30850 [Streptomyces spinoverrucosus]|uniref:hypothetical protein n=1 Tax=Streptomyces spinoverrucosus TaxID=284043 RepID=UPI0018C3E0E8|nr:hypothetical protein [Streptomyces spinoverrucosus]MBG0856131.1 hypothetical protein [Streptomyces spinoverrucosus]
MGIRMLSRRTTPAQPPPPPPAHAVGASTARIPADPATALCHAAVDLRRRVVAHWASRRPAVRPRDTAAGRLWAGLARVYLAVCLALLRRPYRPVRTLTVFIAPLPTVAGAIKPPDGSGSAPCRPLPNH